MLLCARLRRICRILIATAAIGAGMTAPAFAASIGVDGVVLQSALGAYRIKHMDVTDSSLGAEDIKALFAGKGTGSIAEQLAKFSAKSIVIPELDYRQTIAGIEQTLVYRDGKMTDIVNGTVGQLDFASGTLTAALPDGKAMGAEIRGMHASKIDLAAVARLMTETTKTLDAPLQPLYGATSIDSYKITLPNLEISVGSASAKDVKGRPLGISMADLVKKIPKPPKAGEQPSPEDMKNLADYMASIFDVYGAFSVAGAELNNLTVRFTGDPLLGAEPFSMTLKRIAMTDYAKSRLGDMTIEGIDVKASKASVHLGKYQVSDFDFKATLAHLATMMKILPTLNDKSAAPPPEFMSSILELYRSFSIGKLELTDFSVGDAKDEATGQPVSVALERAALTDFGKARVGEFSVGGFDIRVPQGKFHLGKFALKGFDFNDLLDSFGTFRAHPTPDADGKIAPPDFKQLKMPKLEEIRIEGVDADLQAPPGLDAQDGEPTPVKFSLQTLSLRPDLGPSGIPSKLSFVADHFKFVFPPNNPQYEIARSAGIDAIDLSSKIEAGWNEAAQQLTIGGLSLAGEGLGKVFVSGAIDNVPREAFFGDEFVRQAAILGAVVKSAEIKVENSSLMEKIITAQAKQSGQSEADMKSTLIAGAAIGIPTMLGNSPAARALANAVAKFLADPKTLHVTAGSKEGVGAGDIAALDKILDKVELTATANEEK